MRQEVSYDEEEAIQTLQPGFQARGIEASQRRSRDEELTKLKRELAKVKQERDFLKDAAVFFAKESK
jgi:transposase-like protein